MVKSLRNKWSEKNNKLKSVVEIFGILSLLVCLFWIERFLFEESQILLYNYYYYLMEMNGN